MECSLYGFDFNDCGGRIHLHHLVNRGKLRGNVAARLYCESLPHIFLAEVCEWHNVMRWADTKQARKYLFLQKVAEYGEEAVVEAINNIPWKVVPYELTYDGIMAVD